MARTTDAARETVVKMCPDCGRHLGDTWDGNACGCCGFRYVHVVHEPRADGRHAAGTMRSAAKGAVASVVALVAAFLAGAMLAMAPESEAADPMLAAVQVAFSPEFAASVVLAVIAVRMLAYGLTRGAP